MMEYKKSPTCLSIPLKQKSGSANQHLAQVHSETNGVIVNLSNMHLKPIVIAN